VFRATEINLGRDVAITFCDGLEARRSESLRKRFQRESQLLARLSHPNTPCVLTTGDIGPLGIPYMILAFLEGPRLRDELTSKKILDQSVAIGVMMDLLAALDAAH